MNQLVPETHSVCVPDTDLEIAAYRGVGGDLYIAINRRRGAGFCLGRIIIERLCELDLDDINVSIGDFVLTQMPERKRSP